MLPSSSSSSLLLPSFGPWSVAIRNLHATHTTTHTWLAYLCNNMFDGNMCLLVVCFVSYERGFRSFFSPNNAKAKPDSQQQRQQKILTACSRARQGRVGVWWPGRGEVKWVRSGVLGGGMAPGGRHGVGGRAG